MMLRSVDEGHTEEPAVSVGERAVRRTQGGRMTAPRVVFLLDVDNTLLDNDRIAADLHSHLQQDFGHDRAQAYWAIYEQLRAELGYADYLGVLQRYRLSCPCDSRLFALSRFLLDYPFADRLFPDALNVVTRLKQWGTVVVLSDGDAVLQPRKIERAGLLDLVESHVLVCVHKEWEMDDVERRYPADHYVVIDDKPGILAAMKAHWRARVTTVCPRQGHYALAPQVWTRHPPPDVLVERIGDVLALSLRELLAASRPALRLVE